jgi:hypothetical protein
MSRDAELVYGWEIRSRPDGSFGVYDSHGLVDGPFGTKEEALTAALRLPRHPPQGDRPGSQTAART